jgi:putative hemolysin
LWRGLARFVARRGYRTLFGPVSISRTYGAASIAVIQAALNRGYGDSELRRLVRARVPFIGPRLSASQRARLSEPLLSVNELDQVVRASTQGEAGLPTLLKHYLKLGGRVLDFNVDHDFGDCVDALLVLDLLNVAPRTLRHLMGAEDGERFLGRHGAVGSAMPARVPSPDQYCAEDDLRIRAFL